MLMITTKVFTNDGQMSLRVDYNDMSEEQQRNLQRMFRIVQGQIMLMICQRNNKGVYKGWLDEFNGRLC